jgi:hypothetical protein
MKRILHLALLTICLAVTTAQAGQLAVIIDDIGYNAELGRRTVDLDGQFTLAVLPFTPHATELAERAHARGKELILHAPMSNIRDIPLERGALKSDMTDAAFTRALTAMIEDIPHIRGVNNHMGSKLTQEQEPMGWLMRELAARKLYFIDSRTSARSLAQQTARQYQIPSLKRDIFLDNERDIASIRTQLRKALVLAQTKDSAIAIGHPYPETLQVLEQIQPLLAEYQVELVSVSTLLARVAISASNNTPLLICPAPPQLLWRRFKAHSLPLYQPDLQNLTDFSYE